MVLLALRAASGISWARAVEWLERALLLMLPFILLPQVSAQAALARHGRTVITSLLPFQTVLRKTV